MWQPRSDLYLDELGRKVRGPGADSLRDGAERRGSCNILATEYRRGSQQCDPSESGFFPMESLILAQNERWRRGLGMQVERESFLREASTAANWLVTGGERALQPGITPGNRS